MASPTASAFVPSEPLMPAPHQHIVAPDHCLVAVELCPMNARNHPLHKGVILFGHPKKTLSKPSNCDCVDSLQDNPKRGHHVSHRGKEKSDQTVAL